MRNYAYVFVGKEARVNYGVGMEAGTWGWKVDSHGQEAREAMAVLRDSHAANYLVFARGARTPNPPPGWPRTKPDDPAWEGAWFDAVTLARVSKPLYHATTRLWPDDVYPFRVGFESPIDLPKTDSGALGREVVMSIAMTALRRGLPVLGPSPLDETEVSPADEPLEPERLLSLEGLDGLTRALFRREQSALRRMRVKDAVRLPCALCHRDLPVGLLRLAHIKRRADATDVERRSSANTMLACTLGCDELFERGYIVVDREGRLRRNETAGLVTEDLEAALVGLVGRRVLHFDNRSAPFFAAHAARHTAPPQGAS